MELANYFQNRLLIKTENYCKLISEEKWGSKCQNVSHIKIFCMEILINILKEKRNKFDNQYI